MTHGDAILILEGCIVENELHGKNTLEDIRWRRSLRRTIMLLQFDHEKVIEEAFNNFQESA